jgi:hypothetical protein
MLQLSINLFDSSESDTEDASDDDDDHADVRV